MSDITDMLNMLGQDSPLVVLNEQEYDTMGYDAELQRWIVKRKGANRYYTLPGTPDKVEWDLPSKPIPATMVNERYIGEQKPGKKKSTKSKSGMLPIVDEWGTQDIKVDVNKLEIDSVMQDVLFGKVSIQDYFYNMLTTPTSSRTYSGKGDKYTDEKGNISFYYSPNSKSWRMGMRDGTTQPIPSGSVPISVWNKAGLVKPSNLSIGGVGSMEELDTFLSSYNTFIDARNAGLNLATDPIKASWFKPESSVIQSPSKTTYLKESSGGWLASGKSIQNVFGKPTMELEPSYTPVEFEADMLARKGWTSPLESGIKNTWVNSYGQPSTIDPALQKTMDKLKVIEEKKRKK